MRTLITTAFLTLLLATPGYSRIRIVGQPAQPFVSFSGTVVDATTGRAVVDAEIVTDGKSTLTNAAGSFTILLPTGVSSTLTVKRTGYESTQVTITPTAGTTSGSPIMLRPIANVVVQRVNGPNVTIDADSFEFFAAQPMGIQLHAKEGAFCENGTAFYVDRSEIARLRGPAVSAGGGSCCMVGGIERQTLFLDVVLKNGQTHRASFVYACYGYDVAVGGRDHDTHQMVYVNALELKQVDIP